MMPLAVGSSPFRAVIRRVGRHGRKHGTAIAVAAVLLLLLCDTVPRALDTIASSSTLSLLWTGTTASAHECCARCIQARQCKAWLFTATAAAGACALHRVPVEGATGEVKQPPSKYPLNFRRPTALGCSICPPQPKTAGPSAGNGDTGSKQQGHPAGARYHLLIAVPTVARPVRSAPAGDQASGEGTADTNSRNGTNATATTEEGVRASYLQRTVSSLLAEVSRESTQRAFSGGVAVVVYSHSAVHPVYDAVKAKTEAAQHRSHGNDTRCCSNGTGAGKVTFVSDGTLASRWDPHAHDQPAVDDHNNPEARPGERARQQTIDFLASPSPVLY